MLPKTSIQRQKAFSEIRKQYHLSENEAQKIASRRRLGHLEELTNSRVVQQIAKRAWCVIEKVMYGKSKRVRFRRYGEFMSGTAEVRDYDEAEPLYIEALTIRKKP